MGGQSSKLEQQLPSKASGGKKQNQDDLITGSTVSTAGSSLPPSPKVSVPTPRRTQASRRRSSRSYPPMAQTMPVTRSNEKQTTPLNLRTNLHHIRRDLEPPPTEQKRTEPVKCPARRSGMSSVDGFAASPSEGDDSHYLMQMYDSRTWQMYRRITEARKNSQYSYESSMLNDSQNQNTSEWENLQHDVMESSNSAHEMIFLFDFD